VVKHLYLAAVVTVIGCASAGGSSSSSTPAVHRNATILSADEIAGAHADLGTAYDAVARLRPTWLTSHGQMSAQTPDTPYAIVFVDGHIHGPLETLRDIPASQVGEFRFYNMIEAGATFGMQAGGTGGVIAVKTR